METNQKPSLFARVAALEPGETASEAKRCSLGFVDRDEFAAVVEKLRNAANPAVKAAKEKTGGTYVIETGDFRTKSYDLVIAVAITRVA